MVHVKMGQKDLSAIAGELQWLNQVNKYNFRCNCLSVLLNCPDVELALEHQIFRFPVALADLWRRTEVPSSSPAPIIHSKLQKQQRPDDKHKQSILKMRIYYILSRAHSPYILCRSAVAYNLWNSAGTNEPWARRMETAQNMLQDYSNLGPLSLWLIACSIMYYEAYGRLYCN